MKQNKDKAKRGSVLGIILTPILLLALCGGSIVLCYSLMPEHYIQRYLNLAFMDSQKISSSTSGLNIKHREIKTDTETTAPPDSQNPTSATVTEKPKLTSGKINFPTFGEQYAKLEAKSINLMVGVFYGVNSELLELGACQSSQSEILGKEGNHVIDAHVNTFFADLNKLAVGDTVTMFTDYGRFTYEVSDKIEFNKSDKRYVTTTEADILTLYTCAPQVLGNSDLRVGVRCLLKDKEFYEPEDGQGGGA